MQVPHHMKNGIQFVLYTNLLVATAAAAQMILSYKLFVLPPNIKLVWVEFSSTLLFYNLALFLSLPKKTTSVFARTNWVLKHPIVFYSLSVSALLIFIYHTLALPKDIQIALFIIGLGAALYVIPVFRIQGKRVNLRSIPYVKVFYISLIWTVSTYYLPLLDSRVSVTMGFVDQVFLGIHRFVFLVLCTLPFDLRDVKSDTHYGLKTLPVLLGRRGIIRLMHILMFLHIIFTFLLGIEAAQKWGFILVDVLLLFVFDYWVFKKQDYISVFILDFILVLQLMIVNLADYFFS